MHGYPTVYLLLGLWVPFCLVAFATMRPQQAALFALLGGVLILPERRGFDISGLPALGKLELSSLGALLGCLVFQTRELIRGRAGAGLEVVLLLAIPFSLATALTNRDPTGGAHYWFPGLRPYDAAGIIFRDLLLLGVPFVLGRTLFRTPESLRLLLKGLIAAALAYSVLVLWEARMSPQLNQYLYGFGQHSFKQTRRFGGWRPMVFMAHGLALSVFLCAAMMAAIGAYRAKLKILRMPAGSVAVYLAVVLLLCRSLASIVYGAVAAPLLLVARPRIAGLAAAGIGMVVLTYPVLRSIDVFPTQTLIDSAASVNELRANSLQTRFDYEDTLLDRARNRIWFGWGGFGRSRYTDDSARALVSDGYWILRLGEQGAAGLGLYFVLVLVPIFQAWRAIPRCPNRNDASLLATLSLILAIQALDTIPNALFNHIPLLMAGAVSGLAVTLPRQARKPKKVVESDAGSEPPSVPPPSAPTLLELAKGKTRGANRRSGGLR
ncbi:MAG: hypothetical protein JRH01_03230 [Deltaproteobacteria bacterium]|nr:hypothetical protein [Deltaproteobacteria bacterium]MBW2395968.1 hypothetical protein [Deltaproteobacteria bacterium]